MERSEGWLPPRAKLLEMGAGRAPLYVKADMPLRAYVLCDARDLDEEATVVGTGGSFRLALHRTARAPDGVPVCADAPQQRQLHMDVQVSGWVRVTGDAVRAEFVTPTTPAKTDTYDAAVRRARVLMRAAIYVGPRARVMPLARTGGDGATRLPRYGYDRLVRACFDIPPATGGVGTQTRVSYEVCGRMSDAERHLLVGRAARPLPVHADRTSCAGSWSYVLVHRSAPWRVRCAEGDGVVYEAGCEHRFACLPSTPTVGGFRGVIESETKDARTLVVWGVLCVSGTRVCAQHALPEWRGKKAGRVPRTTPYDSADVQCPVPAQICMYRDGGEVVAMIDGDVVLARGVVDKVRLHNAFAPRAAADAK